VVPHSDILSFNIFDQGTKLRLEPPSLHLPPLDFVTGQLLENNSSSFGRHQCLDQLSDTHGQRGIGLARGQGSALSQRLALCVIV